MKAGLIGALKAAVLAIFFIVGYQLAAAQGRAKLADAKETAAREMVQATGKIRALEAARVADIDAIAQLHVKEMTDAKNQMDALRADVRSGAVRLSVAVRPRTCPAIAGSDPAPAGEPAETRADLMPAVADALVSIAADGDDAVRDLNTCIDSYHAIKSRAP